MSVYSCDLSDIERRAPIAAALLHALPQAAAARTVAQGAGKMATAPRCHGYSGHRSKGCLGSEAKVDQGTQSINCSCRVGLDPTVRKGKTD